MKEIEKKSLISRFIEKTQAHLIFHIVEGCHYMRLLMKSKQPKFGTEIIGALFSLWTIFLEGVPKEFPSLEFNICPSDLVKFTPQLHSMMHSANRTIVQVSSKYLIQIARTETYSYVKFEIFASWFFEKAQDTKNNFIKILNQVCDSNEISTMTIFIKGLCNISKSWDERWLHELQLTYLYFGKVFKKVTPYLSKIFESDYSLERKKSVLKDTYNAFMDRICKGIKGIISMTEKCRLETKSGGEFWQKYGENILILVNSLEKPPCNMAELEEKRIAIKEV